ncbi:MAG TPA: TfoX/Sxy family protein [Planctomycetota bacterium]|nr:TfoX/Sxy family protein [Planctomycetota bacterium]
MAYDESLAARLRTAFGRTQVVEKHMFGGLAMMVRGHMCCGIVSDKLMVRVGPELYEAALKMKHAQPMTFTGKPMKGMLYVTPEGCNTVPKIVGWLKLALIFNATLPAK